MASHQSLDVLNKCASDIEDIVGADIFLYNGLINSFYKLNFVREIERLARASNRDKLYFCITTFGGEVEMTEVMVNVMRHFYKEVNFVVPNYAYSAGTILCMSGDKIFMNYYSSLGPIDTQVKVNEKFVSSQGYIEQFELLKEKSKNNTITPIEICMALNLNLADLNHYIQSRNLTVTLLKNWLVQYKFKDWDVDINKKSARAEEIALKLGDNNLWHSHARCIGIDTLRNELKLKIEDIGEDPRLQAAFNNYEALANAACYHNPTVPFMHSKCC